MKNHFRRIKNRSKSGVKSYYYRFYKEFSKNAFPDFLVIGALKSGTTSLYHYLNNHSQVASSSIKETNFFSWEYNRGIQYYLNFFPLKKEVIGNLVFEACPHYLADPKSARRIKAVLPHVKLIAILRDPIERAISNYNYFSSSTSKFGIQNPGQLDGRNIDQAFNDDLEGKEKRLFRQYCRLSLYGEQLKKYYEKFSSKNILVLDFDLMKTDIKRFLKKVTDFLEIDHEEFHAFLQSEETVESDASFEKKQDKTFRKYNVQHYSLQVDPQTGKDLIGFYTKDIQLLHQLSGTTFNWGKKYI